MREKRSIFADNKNEKNYAQKTTQGL